MAHPTPRELVNVLVDADASGIVAPFDLGHSFPAEPVAEWFTYGIALVDEGGADCPIDGRSSGHLLQPLSIARVQVAPGLRIRV
jgi:hypothetical protein